MEPKSPLPQVYCTGNGIMYPQHGPGPCTQITNTLRSTSKSYWSNTTVLDQCLIDVDLIIFVIDMYDAVEILSANGSAAFTESCSAIGRKSFAYRNIAVVLQGPAYCGWATSTVTSPWWRHQMETFSALLAICAGNSPVTGEFPAQRPVTQSFDVFFDLCLNKPLSKQSGGWWFEMPLHPSWCHCNAICCFFCYFSKLITNKLL